MNYKATTDILRSLKPYIGDVATITTDNKNLENRDYKSDIVEIDKKNNVGFEVLDNEIIVYFFSAHKHFEDYTVQPAEEEDDYIERAKSFLLDLFKYKICKTKYYKNNKVYSEQYYISCGNDMGNNYIGGIVSSIMRSVSPFGKKSRKQTMWFFDKTKGCFVTRNERTYDNEAVEIIEINDDCYVEIFCRHNSYTYNVIAIDYDDYNCMYYWAPARNIVEPGWYDTKERAIEEMKKMVLEDFVEVGHRSY